MKVSLFLILNAYFPNNQSGRIIMLINDSINNIEIFLNSGAFESTVQKHSDTLH